MVRHNREAHQTCNPGVEAYPDRGRLASDKSSQIKSYVEHDILIIGWKLIAEIRSLGTIYVINFTT